MTVSINRQTLLFLSVASQPGNFGATIFNALFAHYGINAVYIPRTAPAPSSFVRSLRTLGVSGCSVSMPLKSKVVPLLDSLSEDARALNSVNTIVQSRGGLLAGHNTDWQGCAEVLRTCAIGSLLVFGTGSVVHSVVHAARTVGVGQILLTGRNSRRVHSKAKELGVGAWTGVKHSPASFDLLVNATPSGDEPGDPVRALLPVCRGLFDLRVRAAPSSLEQEAQKHGLWTIPGVAMAKVQLQKQMQLYTGILPPLDLLDSLIQSGFLAVPPAPPTGGG